MATRGRTTFQKKQKEMARKERQQMKAARREHRRVARSGGEKAPPQDPPETSTYLDGVERTDEPSRWIPIHRGHSNL